MKLAIAKLRLDGGTQPREAIEWSTVEEYVEDMTTGAEFPPVIVFHDGIEHWLADGFHRVNAAQSTSQDEIEADVRQGTKQDAVWFACSANQGHGLRRTNADKRRAVMAALQHPRGRKLSDRAIAEHCGVSPQTVTTVRGQLSKLDSSATLEKREGKDGKRRSERSDSKKNQEAEKRKTQTANATRASVEARSKRKANLVVIGDASGEGLTKRVEEQTALTSLEALRDVLAWISQHSIVIHDDPRYQRWVRAAASNGDRK